MSRAALFMRGCLLAAGTLALGCAANRPRPADPAAQARAAQSTTAPTPVHPVREELDVVYCRAGGEDLQLDLYAPKDVTGPLPAVVVLHGGAWHSGSHETMRPVANTLAAQGYVALTVSYRLAPRHVFPAQLHDVKCAVRWLRANADRYQVDRDHVGVIGYSAGGHLALLLGLTQSKDGLEGEGGYADQSSSVQAVVNLSGATDLTRPDWSPGIEGSLADLLGGARAQVPDRYRAASPLAYVHRGAPPVLTIHGTADQVVPYEQAQLIHTALRKARDESHLETIHGGNHGLWNGKNAQRTGPAILDFLDKNLRPR